MKFFLLMLLLALGATTASAQISYQFGSKNYPGIDSGEVFIEVISTECYKSEIAKVSWSSPSGYHSDPYFYWHDPEMAFQVNFSKIPWKTKRAGDIAYTSSGKLLPGHRPIFVQKSELIAAGMLKE